jgi:hypothetical protein
MTTTRTSTEHHFSTRSSTSRYVPTHRRRLAHRICTTVPAENVVQRYAASDGRVPSSQLARKPLFTKGFWRRERDSNPRWLGGHCGFQAGTAEVRDSPGTAGAVRIAGRTIRARSRMCACGRPQRCHLRCQPQHRPTLALSAGALSRARNAHVNSGGWTWRGTPKQADRSRAACSPNR